MVSHYFESKFVKMNDNYYEYNIKEYVKNKNQFFKFLFIFVQVTTL